MSPDFQHIVIGAGHNGLVCAITLARKGRRVLLLEAADQVGGLAVTREFAPGFRASGAAHLLDAFPADLLRELALERHGLRFAARALPTVALDPAGASLRLAGARLEGATPADTAAYARFEARMARFARVMDRLLRAVPFRLALSSWHERLAALRLALHLRLLGRRDMQELLRIAGMNVHDLLGEHFVSDRLKGALAFDACLGAEHGPRAPGTVLNLLYRRAGRTAAGRLGTALPLGGMGGLTQAMARAAEGAGVVIRTASPVARILVEDDHACGVALASGETLRAGSVISNVDPKTTFLTLLGPEHLDTDFVRRIDHFRSQGRVARIHLALSAAPRFTGLAEGAHGGRLLLCPSADALELAFNPCKYGEIPAEPALEICVPTLHDPGLAPPGHHVLSINAMFVPYDLGPDPDGARRRLLEAVLLRLESHAPGLREQVLASEVLTPLDLERRFGCAGGHWHHGALSFDQFFFNRPVPGAAQYATPLPGLFLCGAGSHPGGGVMGIAGRNAARIVIQGGTPHAAARRV